MNTFQKTVLLWLPIICVLLSLILVAIMFAAFGDAVGNGWTLAMALCWGAWVVHAGVTANREGREN